MSSLLFNTVLQKALEEDIPRWKKKRGMGICLSDNDHGCFTDMRFADDVLLFASSEEQLQKMLCEFKRSIEKVGLGIHQGKTKILRNQCSDTGKEIAVDNLSRNTDKSRKHEILGSEDHFSATGDDRNQKSNQGCLGDASQVQTRTDVEKLPAQTSTPAFRRSDNSDDMLRIKNTEEHERMIQSTQRKMFRPSYKRKEDTKRS